MQKRENIQFDRGREWKLDQIQVLLKFFIWWWDFGRWKKQVAVDNDFSV